MLINESRETMKERGLKKLTNTITKSSLTGFNPLIIGRKNSVLCEISIGIRRSGKNIRKAQRNLP